MTGKIDGGAKGDGNRACADRNVRGGYTDNIDQQRYGQDRTTATYQAQDKADCAS
jgi:hypothetical protein